MKADGSGYSNRIKRDLLRVINIILLIKHENVILFR